MVGNADERCLRAHGDNPAGAVFEHDLPGCLGREEEALRVDVHHVVPVGLGDIDRWMVCSEPSVRNEHIDASVLLRDVVECGVDRADVGNVHHMAGCAAARGHDLRGDGGGLVRRPSGEGNGGSRRGERVDEATPDPAGRSGDHDDLSVERERWKVLGVHPLTLTLRTQWRRGPAHHSWAGMLRRRRPAVLITTVGGWTASRSRSN